MSTVSPGGGGGIGRSSNTPQKGFIISPTSLSDEDELMIIQNFNQIQLGERKKIGIIGTQELSENHQQMIELVGLLAIFSLNTSQQPLTDYQLSYALVLSGNHVFTSGGGNGTNIAVIRGALRACNPDLLTVILPQSLNLQPPEMQV